MPEIEILHNLKDPSDSQGRSYKEVNLEKKHKIPVGSLVELDTGARLFVVMHTRDCDGTPLYSLCHDKEDTKWVNSIFANRAWDSGYDEDSLKLISI